MYKGDTEFGMGHTLRTWFIIVSARTDAFKSRITSLAAATPGAHAVKHMMLSPVVRITSCTRLARAAVYAFSSF